MINDDKLRRLSPFEVLQENKYVVATREKPVHVYGLYPTEDIASRICNDLNKRYDNSYEVYIIGFENADVYKTCDSTDETFGDREQDSTE